jgi:S-adenosylhomocysteine hydrolase
MAAAYILHLVGFSDSSEMLKVTTNLIESNIEILKRFDYVVVQHLKGDTAEFVTRLFRNGCTLSRVVGVNYSADPGVLQFLLDCGIAAEMRDFSEISDCLREIIFLQGRRVVLLDVGGYGSEIVAANDAEKIEFVVEDTNNGLWRYQSIKPLCPIIDVASIENKSVENGFVGRRIVDGVMSFFVESKISAPVRDYAVIGYGGVGQNVCLALALKGINAAVIELDERKLAIAEARGHPVARTISEFTAAKVIIGCTGRSSVTFDDLKMLSNQPFLFSGSSKKVEFYDVLARGATSPVHAQNALVESETGATIVNEGQPINLLYGSLSAEISDFMFANITAAILEGSTIRTSGIFKLSDSRQREICRLWFDQYIR